MSIEQVARALPIQGLQPTTKLVLIGLANHDGDGGCWPSLATLARYAGCTTRTVRRCLRELEQAGLISTVANRGGTHRTPNDRRPNLYMLHLPDTWVAGRGGTWVSPEPSLEPS